MSYKTKNIFTYLTFLYQPDEDHEPDNIKIFHTVIDERYGTEQHMPLSPYEFAKEETFRAWIDSGAPSREQINASLGKSNMGNPSQQDIMDYFIEHTLVKQ